MCRRCTVVCLLLWGVCDLDISEMLTEVDILDIYHFLLIYQTY